MKRSLEEIIGNHAHRIAELERRNLGRRREGKIVEIDQAQGLYKVRFREGFTSPWIPAEALAAGAVKIQAEPTAGQAVVVTSESGDMTDAVVSLSSFTDGNARPHDKAGELRITVGAADILAKADLLRLVCGSASIELDAAGVRINGTRIDLNTT